MNDRDLELINALDEHALWMILHHDDCDTDYCEGCIDAEMSPSEKARAELAADKAKGQRQADEWNAKYPVGTPVMAYPGVRPEDPVAVSYRRRVEQGRTFRSETDPTEGFETVTRSVAWPLGHGEPVVLVKGYSGGIVLKHIDVVANGGESRG